MQYKDVRINKNLRNVNSYNVSSFTGSYICISYLPKHANSMYLQLTKPPNALINPSQNVDVTWKGNYTDPK